MALSPLERQHLPEEPAAKTRVPDRVLPAASVVRGPRAVALGGVILVAALVAALIVGGGAPSAPIGNLPDPGPVTGWGLPFTTLFARLLAVLTVGQLAFAALLTSPTPQGPSPGALRALRWSTWSAAGWLLAELVSLVLTASTIYGVPVTQLSVQAVTALAVELPIGRSTLWVAVLLVLVAAGSAWVARFSDDAHRYAGLLLLAALGAVTIPGVLAGHSAAAGNHVPAVLALTVHVLTASLWVGGLAALLLHGRGRYESVPAVRRFSVLALGCLTLLLLSGVAAAFLVAGLPRWSWFGEGWAQLLALKTILLALLGLIGWRHRQATLPALAAERPRAFVRLGLVEVALMALTITLSVALSASAAPTPPPADSTAAAGEQTPPADGPGEGTPGDDAPEADPDSQADGAEVDPDASAPEGEQPIDDMSGHDHGDLSVSILIDDQRFHVSATVRPGQPVTVYNSSDEAATITALDDGFDVEAPARTFITFPAPEDEGSYEFVSEPGGDPAAGFADTLTVRAAP